MLAVALLAVVLVPFTLTGVSVALDGSDGMATSLRAGPSSLQWVVNGYSATFAGFMLVTGALADRWGPVRVFGGGVALFASCGVVSAAAGDVVLLDASRLVAGVGAAATTTGASALLAARFAPERRTRVFGAFGAAIGGGLALGPTLAGAVTDTLGWRAVFAIPAGVGLLLALATRWMPRPDTVATRTDAPRSDAPALDVPGAVAITAALLLGVLGLVEGSDLGRTSPVVVVALVAALASFALFVVIERRSTHPLVDLRAVLTGPFLGACLAVAAAVGAFGPLLIYLPTFFQNALGLDAADAGVLLLALTAPSLVVPVLCGWLTRWVPPRVLVVAGVLLVTVGCGWFALGDAIVAPLLLAGIGIAVAQGLLDAVAIGAAPPEAVGAAAGAFNTTKLSAETIGIAAVGAALVGSSGVRLSGPALAPTLHAAAGVLAVIAAVAAGVVAVLLPAREGRPGNTAPEDRSEDEAREGVSL